MGESKRRKLTDPNYGKNLNVDSLIAGGFQVLTVGRFAKLNYDHSGRGIVVYLGLGHPAEFVCLKDTYVSASDSALVGAYDPETQFVLLRPVDEKYPKGFSITSVLPLNSQESEQLKVAVHESSPIFQNARN